MSGNGKMPHRKSDRSDAEIPMTGVFPVGKVAGWFMHRREEFLDILSQLGIFVGQDGLVDMAELFAAMDAAPKGDGVVPILVDAIS